jgi:hypothetical protein
MTKWRWGATKDLIKLKGTKRRYLRPPKPDTAADCVIETARNRRIHRHLTHPDQWSLRAPKLNGAWDTSSFGGFNDNIGGRVRLRRPERSPFWFELVLAANLAVSWLTENIAPSPRVPEIVGPQKLPRAKAEVKRPETIAWTSVPARQPTRTAATWALPKLATALSKKLNYWAKTQEHY